MRKILIIMSLCLAVFSVALISMTIVERAIYNGREEANRFEGSGIEASVPSVPEETTKGNKEDDKQNSESASENVVNNSSALSSKVAFAIEKGSDKGSIVVLGVPEREYVEVKASPSSGSKVLGRIYGSLAEVKVVGGDKGYALIEGRDYNTHKLIRGYVPESKLKVLEVNPEYRITVDLSEQTTYVFSSNKLIREIPVSTGIEGYDTIKGRFILGTRDKEFFTDRYKEGAYNWVRFNRAYLFHSIPFDENKRLKTEANEKLGQRASHGCIRMSLENSKWFYENMPQGTEVVVQD